MRPLIVLTALLAVAACATPEVAEDYEAKTYLPDELKAALASDDPSQRADAAGQVERMAPERRQAVLTELSRDERASVRLLAVNLLGKLHGEEEATVARLAEVLAFDVDVDVRSAAVTALASSGSVEGLKALVQALADDPSLAVKRSVGTVLDRLTGEKLGSELSDRVDEAEAAADDAMIAYDDWLQANLETIRWDPEVSRFVIGN